MLFHHYQRTWPTWSQYFCSVSVLFFPCCHSRVNPEAVQVMKTIDEFKRCRHFYIPYEKNASYDSLYSKSGFYLELPTERQQPCHRLLINSPEILHHKTNPLSASQWQQRPILKTCGCPKAECNPELQMQFIFSNLKFETFTWSSMWRSIESQKNLQKIWRGKASNGARECTLKRT